MSYQDSTPEEDLIIRSESDMLRLTLNRPKVINALTPGMVHGVGEALTEAENDPKVRLVYLDGAGERGLCAGGDINMTVTASAEEMVRFWSHEYDVNLQISRFSKPYVAVMDGITMGGGIGLSAHGNLRIVTERSRLALPEVRIGFIPDVGGTLLLARAPGKLGLHLALTAGNMDASDALLCGFADVYVPSKNLDALRAALAEEAADVHDTVQRFAEQAPPSRLSDQREWIDYCYGAPTVVEVLERLRQHHDPAAQKTADTIEQMSPNAVVMAFAAHHKAIELDDLADVLALEKRIGEAMITTPDMKEGVRAQIIDKDRNPRWQPATIGQVDSDWIKKVVEDHDREFV